MNELDKKYYRQAEKAYTETQEEYDDNSRATDSEDSDILLLILAELKKSNNTLSRINRKLSKEDDE